MASDNTIKNILIVFLMVLVFYLLSVLSSIIIPLVLALLCAILFQPMIMFFLKKGVPKFLMLPIISIISLSILFVIGLVTADTVTQIAEQKDFLISKFLLKLDALLVQINELFHLKLDSTMLVAELYSMIKEGWLADFAGSLASELGSFASSFLWFALYYVMLLAGMSGYREYIRYVGGRKADELLHEYEVIQSSIVSYMGIKTILSLLVGTLTYLVCVFYGVKFAMFWGFIAFILNFIPSIGSILGTVLPILMGVIQLDSITDVGVMSIILIVMHFSIGNIVEPIVMGGQLRINTLTVLFGLVFWGFVWGIPGMVLSVPLLVIMKIILERSQSTEMIGRLMGYPDKV